MDEREAFMENMADSGKATCGGNLPSNTSIIFFKEYFDIKSEFIFVETLETAHLLVAANKGYFPIDFTHPPKNFSGMKYLPLMREGKQLCRKYE